MYWQTLGFSRRLLCLCTCWHALESTSQDTPFWRAPKTFPRRPHPLQTNLAPPQDVRTTLANQRYADITPAAQVQSATG